MYNFRTNSKRANQAVIMLMIFGCLQVFTLLSIYIDISTYQSIIDHGLFAGVDTLLLVKGLLVSFLGLVLTILTAIYFIRWFRRAYYNQEQMFGTDMNYSNAWCAGSWFVPFLNLFRPVQLMKEMFENANFKLDKLDRENNERRDNTLITIWWTGWIIVSIFTRVIAQLSIRETNLNVTIFYGYILLTITLIHMALVYPLIRIIRNYQEKEAILIQHFEKQNDAKFEINLKNEILDA